MMSLELTTWSPLWLELSGLPQMLGAKPGGAAMWAVFKKIVELDCAANSEPGTVEVALEELAWRSALAPAAARRALLSLRRLKLVACFVPDNDEEAALARVRTPLAAPLRRDELVARWPRVFTAAPAHLRYLDEAPSGGAAADDGRDTVLQEIVDLYFNAVGLKMNVFVLDELRLVRQRFPIEAVRRVFHRARQNEIRSLQWIVRELVRGRRSHEQKNS
ncbi:MAG: hypothetical protein WCK47_08115 [bacterium]|nr:hypothetical protein [Candidatus Sumerlaeota bacterium]